MGETMLQRIKRINANEKTFLADTEDKPGDVFMVTKYLAENGVTTNGRYYSEELPDTHQAVSDDWGGYRAAAYKSVDKNKLKKVLDIFDVSGYNNYYYIELGTHTLAKNVVNRYTPDFPHYGNLSFQFKKDFGARKIPTIRYDIRTFFPEEMLDDKGDFVFNFNNVKKYYKLMQGENARVYGYSMGTVFCGECTERTNIIDIPEKSIKAVVRNNLGAVSLKFNCPKCNNSNLEWAIQITPFSTIPAGFRYIISDVRLSSKHFVRTRYNGGSTTSKLYPDNSDNWSTWSNNWGKVVLPAVMEYANSKNIPVEVTTNAVVRW